MRRPLRRPRYVKLTDTRSAMRRLLEKTRESGVAIPDYDQQYRTIWKAHRLGLIEEGTGYGHQGKLTEAGRAWLDNPKHR